MAEQSKIVAYRGPEESFETLFAFIESAVLDDRYDVDTRKALAIAKQSILDASFAEGLTISDIKIGKKYKTSMSMSDSKWRGIKVTCQKKNRKTVVIELLQPLHDLSKLSGERFKIDPRLLEEVDA